MYRTHLPALVLLAAVTLGVLFAGGLGAVGHPVGDMPDHLWGTWWWGRQVLSGQLPLTTDITHYPTPLSLWHIDPVGAAVGLLLRPLGFPAAWNGVVFLQLLLGGLAGYATTWDLLRSRAAAVTSGLLLVTSPYLLGVLHSGLSELLGMAAPVALCWALVRTMGLDPQGRPPLRHGPWISGVLVSLCALQSFYYGAFGGLLAACAVLGPGWRGRLAALAKLTAAFAVTTLPWMLPLYRTLQGGAVSDESAPGWGHTFLPGTDLLTFFWPGDYYFPDTIANGNPGIIQVSYLGWVAAGAAAWGLWRQPALRRLVPMMATYGVLMLGPRLVIGGEMLDLPGTDLPFYLPLAALYVDGSPLQLVHHPYRMVALFLPLLSLLAGAGVAAAPRPWSAGLVALAVAEALLISPAKWPLATADLTPPPLALSAEEGPRLDWPADATRWNRRYLLWQVSHHQPIPYGINVFLGEDLRRDPVVRALLESLDDPRARASNRDVPYDGPIVPMGGEETSLEALGVGVLLLHRAALSEGEHARAEAILRDAYGDPIEADADTMVWRPVRRSVDDRRRPGGSRRRP